MTDEIEQTIKNNFYNIDSSFTQNDNLPTGNSYLTLDKGKLNPIIRYSNHPDSTEWKLFDSLELFNGQISGSINGYSLIIYIKKNFQILK